MELKNPEFHGRLKHLIGDEKPFRWAVRVGISKGAFARIWKEGTIPGPDFLKLIAESTGVSVDWLLTGEGPMKRADAVQGSVAAKGGADYGLTEEEQTLLAIYNDLSDESKDELEIALQRLVDQEQDEKKKRVNLLGKLRKGAG